MLQLQIECHRDDIEELSTFLEDNTSLSLTYTDKSDDPILEPAIGTTPLWPGVVLQVLYASKKEAEQALERLTTKYPHFTATIEPLPDQDWERAWMNDFTPMQFGEKLWICPSWTPPPHPEAANLILDPGLAFGTGTHPTTSLCLTWLDKANISGKQIIDYGCGSGILALAALKLGAKHAYAVDLDEQALIATHNNATKNKITDDQLHICKPDSLEKKADVLLANILLSPLMTLKDRFHQLLKPGGTLVTSGILTNQQDTLINAYQDLFTLETSMILDEWSLLIFNPRF